MSALFSLFDDSYYLEFDCAGPVQLSRRAAAVETLEGADTRDLGAADDGVKLSVQTELSDTETAGLFDAAQAGLPLGLTLGIKSRRVAVVRIQSAKLFGGRSGVTLDLLSAGGL